MAHYNVLTEPWITALAEDGSALETGILGVLSEAHRLDSVVDDAPTIQFGVYRLLIAFLLDALGLRELEDVAATFSAGRFDAAVLERYVDRVGRSRFDLFDSEHPFLQDGTAVAGQIREKPVAELFFHLPTGSNHLHFHHVEAAEHALSPAVCALALCTQACFATAGGRGYSPSVNGTPPLYLLVRGRNLFETLLLNCYAATDLGLPRDVPPAWRDDAPMEPGAIRACRSLAQGLTWRPRSVRLIAAEGGRCTYSGRESSILVRTILHGPGFKAEGPEWTDPQVAYRTNEKGRVPLRPREDREVWRETGPLLLLRDVDYDGDEGRVVFSRPAIVDQLRELQRGRYIPSGGRETFEVYAMRADKAKVLEWQYERLTLPQGIGSNTAAGQQSQEAMDLADSVAYYLGRSVKRAYPRHGAANERALQRVLQRGLFLYWAALQQRYREELLEGLAAQGPDDTEARVRLLDGWRQALWEEGRKALEVAIGPLDSDAPALMRQQEASSVFARSVAHLFRPLDSNGAEPKRQGGSANG